jgi:hypothetical protein
VLSQTGVVPSQLTTFPKITCCEVEGFPDALTANSDGSAGRQILRRLLGRYLQTLNLAVTSVGIAFSCSDAVRTPASWNRFYAAVLSPSPRAVVARARYPVMLVAIDQMTSARMPGR